MSRIEDTVGNITITIDHCDCGLTGGCEKCQPIYIPKQNNVEYTLIPRRETYQDFGIRLKGEIERHPEWGCKLI